MTQRMAMAMVGGEPFLEARPLTRDAMSTEGLRWGWDMVLDEVQDVEVEPWELPEEEVVLTSQLPKHHVVWFNFSRIRGGQKPKKRKGPSLPMCCRPTCPTWRWTSRELGV